MLVVGGIRRSLHVMRHIILFVDIGLLTKVDADVQGNWTSSSVGIIGELSVIEP